MKHSTMPLMRVLLLLRKFNVEIARLEVEQKGAASFRVCCMLNFDHAYRTQTVYKKIGRLYDIQKLSASTTHYEKNTPHE